MAANNVRMDFKYVLIMAITLFMNRPNKETIIFRRIQVLVGWLLVSATVNEQSAIQLIITFITSMKH